MMSLRTLVLVAAALAAPLTLSVCGKVSSPEFPPGSNYPQQYPPQDTSGAERQKAPESQPGTLSGNKTKDGAVGRQGFPLEYPNRLSY